MSLIFRLTGPKFGTHILKNNGTGLLSFVRPVTLKAKAAGCPTVEGHDERNMKLGRPQSPHLTIYAPQLTSMLSITHRATGIVLSGYAVALGVGSLVLPESIPHYIESLECAEVGSACISSLKGILVFPLTYHFWNGIRHLLWDAGLFLSIKEVYLTGYVMLILAIVSAAALAVM